MDKYQEVVLESLRMLLWENYRKYDLMKARDHPGLNSVELNEISEQVTKINNLLNPQQSQTPDEKSQDDLVGTNDIPKSKNRCGRCERYNLSDEEASLCEECDDEMVREGEELE